MDGGKELLKEVLETKNPEKQSCCSCWYKCYISSAWEDGTIWNTLCLWKSIYGNIPQRVKFQGVKLAYFKNFTFPITTVSSNLRAENTRLAALRIISSERWKATFRFEKVLGLGSIFGSWNDFWKMKAETPKGSAGVRSNSVFLIKLTIYCLLAGTDSRDGNVLLGWIKLSGCLLVHSRAF